MIRHHLQHFEILLLKCVKSTHFNWIFGCTSGSEIPPIAFKLYISTYVLWLADYKYDHENWCRHLQGQNPKKPHFSRFSYYLNEYWFERTNF